MEIKGKVVSIELDTEIVGQNGNYQGSQISYRDSSGKLQEKGFHPNALKFNPALKNGLENLQAGDNFVANAEKNDKGYWNWTSIAKAGDGATAHTKQATAQPNTKAPANSSSGGNWATAEERAQTQVYIVRQSSITAALNLCSQQKDFFKGTENPVGEVIKLAEQFEAWVLGQAKRPDIKPGKLAVVGGSDVADPFDDIENDVPY